MSSISFSIPTLWSTSILNTSNIYSKEISSCFSRTCEFHNHCFITFHTKTIIGSDGTTVLDGVENLEFNGFAFDWGYKVGIGDFDGDGINDIGVRRASNKTWYILNSSGVVDFTIGKGVAPGVFVIVKATHPRIIERMDDLHIGHGPYYGFFRPYHLTSLEVPLTCARIMLTGKPDMVPLPRPVAEVCAVAKRDLQPGEALDAIGETCYRSFAMTVTDARAASALPVGLLEGGKVTAPVKKGELITGDNARPDTSTRLFALRQEQDRLLGLAV